MWQEWGDVQVSVRTPVFSQQIGVHGVAKASGVRRCVRRGAARVWRATRLIAFP